MVKRKTLFLAVVGIVLTAAFLFPAGIQEEVRYPVKGFTPVQRQATVAEAGKSVELNIFSTNDEHGWLVDWDFGQGAPRTYRGKPAPSGLTRVSTLYKQLSARYPNPLIVSTGDSIQGTLLSYYYNFIETDKVNPVSRAFQEMGYTCWTVGNHEVEQGYLVMLTVANEMAARNIAVLSANAVWKNNHDEPYYLPYLVKEIDGVRVGFLGLTTPGIPMWLAASTHQEHVFLDMVETARKYVPILRDVEKVDVLIGVFHSGMNEVYDLDKARAFGVPAPNASALVARAIGGGPRGFDAIITGHSHQTIDDKVNTEYKDNNSNLVNGVTFLQAANWGTKLGHLRLSVAARGGRWVVQDVRVSTYPMDGVAEDPALLAAMAGYVQGAKDYAAAPVGRATADLPFQLSLFQETAIVDLIHETQRHFSGAEISIAASFGADGVIPKGDISVGSIAKIYIYENFLNAVRLTGEQIKEYLEYSSKYYNVINWDNVDTEPLVNSEVPGYNYDMAQGFYYEIDLTKTPGERIVNMRNLDGSPFDLKKSYNVTLNSYRYNGGGGHLTACGAMVGGILVADTTYQSSMAMRDLMIEYLKVKKTWGPEDIQSNWKLVPEDLAVRAIHNHLEAIGQESVVDAYK
jgi:2',3'-cyclic-nucleotide 2'-phosphodiesterase (5'-nucleotidase family)